MNDVPVVTINGYPRKIPTETGGEIPPNGKRLLTALLPEEIQALIEDVDDESFAVQLGRMNQKYIETYIKPVEEAISKITDELYKKIADKLI